MSERDDATKDEKKGDQHVDCRKLVGLLGDYVDEQLPDEIKAAFEEHIAQCAPCIAFVKQYRFAPEQARAVLLRKVPTDLEARLLSFLSAKCKDQA